MSIATTNIEIKAVVVQSAQYARAVFNHHITMHFHYLEKAEDSSSIEGQRHYERLATEESAHAREMDLLYWNKLKEEDPSTYNNIKKQLR